jgi:hypothetical protein
MEVGRLGGALTRRWRMTGRGRWRRTDGGSLRRVADKGDVLHIGAAAPWSRGARPPFSRGVMVFLLHWTRVQQHAPSRVESKKNAAAGR